MNGRINLHATMPSMSGHQQGALLDYIVDCYEEFNTVQKPSFRNMMNAFSSKSFVATKEGIKALVNKRMEIVDEFIKDVLNNNEFSLTLDHWSSRANHSYLGITIHFIDKDWQLS